MAPGIARLETDRVVIRMRLNGVVYVRGEPVVVLWMVVVRVGMRMQRRCRADGRCQGHSEQDRCQTPHGPECM